MKDALFPQVDGLRVERMALLSESITAFYEIQVSVYRKRGKGLYINIFLILKPVVETTLNRVYARVK